MENPYLNRYITYKWSIFHSYLSHSQRVSLPIHRPLLRDTLQTTFRRGLGHALGQVHRGHAPRLRHGNLSLAEEGQDVPERDTETLWDLWDLWDLYGNSGMFCEFIWNLHGNSWDLWDF